MLTLYLASGHPVTRIAFRPDGAGFAVAQPHVGVTLIDRATGQPTRTVGNPRVAGYTGLAFYNGGARLAVASHRGVEVFDADTGDRVYVNDRWYMKGALLAVRGPGDGGELLTGQNDHLISGLYLLPLLEPRDEGPPRGRVWTANYVRLLALSADGRWAWCLTRAERPTLVDTTDGAWAASIGQWDDPPAAWAVTFAPDNSRFAAADGRAVRVFDIPPREPSPLRPGGADWLPEPRAVLDPVFTLDPPEPWPAAEPWLPPVAFTPDGRALLVRRPRNRVQLWDAAAGGLLAEWGWRLPGVTCLAVAPDGLTAAAGGRFGRAVVWDLE